MFYVIIFFKEEIELINNENIIRVKHEIFNHGKMYFSREVMEGFWNEISQREIKSFNSYFVQLKQKENEVMLEFAGLTDNSIIDIVQGKTERTTVTLLLNTINQIVTKETNNKLTAYILNNQSRSPALAYEIDKSISKNKKNINKAKRLKDFIRKIENAIGGC